MLRVLTVTAIAAGMMAGSAAANITLDFTTSAIGVSTASTPTAVGFGGITYTISGSPRALVDSTRENSRGKVGCTGQGWDFACAPVSNTSKFDVGFGVAGINNNEVDGSISPDE